MALHREKADESQSAVELREELGRLRESEDLLRDQNDELMEAQQLLEDAKDDYAEIQDLAPLPLLSLTAAGLIRSANLAAAELLREERSRLVGRAFLNRCAKAERAKIGALLANAETAQGGVRAVLALRDGASLPVEIRLRASPRRAGVLYMTLFDLTQREREAREREELLRSSQSKDQLIAMLSHELRTPLTPALAIASKMTREPELRSELRESFEIIHRNLEAEARLIDDLLDATGIARGKVRIARQSVDLHELVRQIVEAWLPRVQAKRLSLEAHLDAGRSYAQADPLRLRQVMSNLLGNALKFTPEGGQIQVRTWNSDGSIVIEISDNGVGFPPEDALRLFAAFEQVERGDRPGAGLGLGLAICKGLVELHGGRITASSAGPGRGARFTVELEVEAEPANVETAAPPPALTKRGSPSGAVRRHRILLVEDHPDTAEVMTELFQELGHDVVTAHSCEEAMGVDLDEVDVIVSDLGLPDGTGLELLPRLRQRRYVPALALSGYGMDADVRAARAAGFERHLTKPVDFARLFEALADLLEQPQSGQVAG
jgi:signal transduction histidine kinase